MIRRLLVALLCVPVSAADVVPLTQTYGGGYTDRQAPAVVGPGLTTTLQDTCMGSTSGGLSLLGFGLVGGSTWKDEECIRRLNARELVSSLGDREAAKELMCGNPEINAVYSALGRPCRLSPSSSIYLVGGAIDTYRVAISGTQRAAVGSGGIGDEGSENVEGKLEAVGAMRLDKWDKGY